MYTAFCVKQVQDGCNIEFNITVREYHTSRDPARPFFAQAGQQTNQKAILPILPAGWGQSLYEAPFALREGNPTLPLSGPERARQPIARSCASL